MAGPVAFTGMNTIFRAPQNWDAEKHGECADLPVMVQDGVCTSAWMPSEAEKALIAAGQPILLAVVGHQPPVLVGVAKNYTPVDMSTITVLPADPVEAAA